MVVYFWEVRATNCTGCYQLLWILAAEAIFVYVFVCLFIYVFVTFEWQRARISFRGCISCDCQRDALKLRIATFLARDYSTHWGARKRKQPETRLNKGQRLHARNEMGSIGYNLLTLLKSDIYICELYSQFALCKMVGDMSRMRMRQQSSLICRICEIRKYLQM